MKKRILTLVIIALVLLCCAPIIGSVGASYQPPDTTVPATLPPNTGTPQPEINVTAYEQQKASLSPWEKKLSSDLLVQETPAVSPGTGIMAAQGSASGDTVAYVYVSVDPSASTHVIDPFVSTVTDRDETNHIAVAQVNFDHLEQLASRSEVRYIQQVIPPRVRMGSAMAESDVLLHTNLLRANLINGTGVKVGVISNGVVHYADAVGTGDLPTVASGKLNILTTGVGDEGTAMLEIIYDMAPGAKLYFHDMGTNKYAFMHAMDDLVAQGCTVIVDDVGWYDEPYFQDGMIAMHVKELILKKNIIYVSAAGNDAQNHYQGSFYSGGGADWWHDFSAGTDAASPYLYVYIPSGGSMDIFLQWDDQFENSVNDYDLYLMKHPSGTFVAQSSWSQGGIFSIYPPREHIHYDNPDSSTDNLFQIRVMKFSGNPSKLELFTWGLQYPVNSVGTDSIFGHPAVPGVIAAGAIPSSSPASIEPFSSQGPVTNLFEAGYRNKPDLAGIDYVSVTGAGGFGSRFSGTSAAAPTIAAAAADLRSAFPEKSGQEIANRLKWTAVDLGAGGYDTVFGWGRPDASNAKTCTVPAGATQIVSSNPAGANIYIDGVSQGTTPKTITGVSWGLHTLKINKTNFMDDYSLFGVGSTGTYGITRTLTAVAGSTTSGGTEVEGNSDNAMFSLWVTYQTGWGIMDFGDNRVMVALEPRASKGISYAISAGDKLDGGKPSATKGKMAEYRYTTGWVPIGWASPGKVFSKPLRLSATPSSPDYVLTGTTDPILFTGVGQGMDTPVPKNYYVKQEVTASDRPVSAAGENRVYRIPITFTLTAL